MTTSTLPHSSDKGPINESNPSTLSPDEPKGEDTYSLAHDRPRRSTIRKPSHYATNDESWLIAYALTVAQETPKGIEPSTYSKAISCPNSSNWLMAMQEEIEVFTKMVLGSYVNFLKVVMPRSLNGSTSVKKVSLGLKMQGG